MLTRERQATIALHRIYRAGDTTEQRLTVAVGEMLRLGGLYVKFAQLMLLNQAFATAIPSELRRAVFDRVYVDTSLDYSTYFRASDMGILTHGLSSIDSYPRYAGSFAAVFDAVHHDGTPVIVKVIRPELRHDLKRDLRMLNMIIKAVGIFKEELRLSLQQTLKTFKESTMRETNYAAEIANTRRIAATLEKDPLIVIPHIYSELSTANFIVQEKLSGIWLTELLQNKQPQAVAEQLVRERIGSDLRVQLYYLGYKNLYNTLSGLPIHGDPHPGNIVLMTGNRIGMIDFGIVAEPVNNRLALLEYIKEQISGKEGDVDLARLMLSIVRFHAGYLYRAVQSLSDFYHRPLMREFYELLRMEVDENRHEIDESKVMTGGYSDMLSGSVNKNNRFALIPKLDNPLTQKAFITLWRIYDDLGFPELTLQVFKNVVIRIEQDNDTISWQETPMPTDRAFEVIAEWLNLVSERDAELFNRMSRIFRPLSTGFGADEPPAPNIMAGPTTK